MSEQADTQVQETAPEQQLSIPKHRFDEVASQVRQLQEALTIKDQIIRQQLTERQPQARKSGPTAEELGIDQQTFLAAQKISDAIVQEKLAPETEKFRGWAAGIANDLDMMKFQVAYPGKESYQDKIKEQQNLHFQRTGQWLDSVTAYKFVRIDEQDRQGNRAAQTTQTAPVTQTTQAAQVNAPNAAGTRVQAGGGGGTAAKTFDQMTVEEKEAALEEQFKVGERA